MKLLGDRADGQNSYVSLKSWPKLVQNRYLSRPPRRSKRERFYLKSYVAVSLLSSYNMSYPSSNKCQIIVGSISAVGCRYLSEVHTQSNVNIYRS